MFIIKKIDRKTIIGVLFTLLLMAGTGVRLFFLSHTPLTAYCEAVGTYYTEINSTFSFTDFFRQFHIEINETPIQEINVQIPEIFNTVYENYNALQKTQGFDLSSYKGETVKRYTFDVLNRRGTDKVKANILVLGNRIIAGDLCTYLLDGNMTALTDNTLIQG